MARCNVPKVRRARAFASTKPQPNTESLMTSFFRTLRVTLRGAYSTVRSFPSSRAQARQPRKAWLAVEALEARELLSAAAAIGSTVSVAAAPAASKTAVVAAQTVASKSPTAQALAAPVIQ